LASEPYAGCLHGDSIDTTREAKSQAEYGPTSIFLHVDAEQHALQTLVYAWCARNKPVDFSNMPS
jgi:hypothetical protein